MNFLVVYSILMTILAIVAYSRANRKDEALALEEENTMQWVERARTAMKKRRELWGELMRVRRELAGTSEREAGFLAAILHTAKINQILTNALKVYAMREDLPAGASPRVVFEPGECYGQTFILETEQTNQGKDCHEIGYRARVALKEVKRLQENFEDARLQEQIEKKKQAALAASSTPSQPLYNQIRSKS
jgi:hypothetical protein